jgi:uncharacterized damage-inducible protein DinB
MSLALVEHPDKVRYPIGDFGVDPDVTATKRREWIQLIVEMPEKLRAAVAGLSAAQLGSSYREGGWTLRQVVHHLADAHTNGFVRFKLALTEDDPVIKTYEEALWAETRDAREAPVELSLALLAALHGRWAILLDALTEDQFDRAFVHPDRGRMTIDKAIQLYAWHCLHHPAQITSLRARKGW